MHAEVLIKINCNCLISSVEIDFITKIIVLEIEVVPLLRNSEWITATLPLYQSLPFRFDLLNDIIDHINQASHKNSLFSISVDLNNNLS